MLLVYDKITGEILRTLPKDQDVEVFYVHYPKEFIESLETMEIDYSLDTISNLIIRDGEISELTELELKEKNEFGRILTEEERILENMKPSNEEVQEAEMTIRVLSILEGVL